MADPMEFVHRAELVRVQCLRLASEAKACKDPHRVLAIQAEMDVLFESMLKIREEQILDALERNKPKPRKRRWWSRG